MNSDKEMAEAERASGRTVQIVRQQGITIDLSEWLTIKRYAERHGLTMEVVINWISRGIIPEDCTLTVPELNDMRLVKNQTYR